MTSPRYPQPDENELNAIRKEVLEFSGVGLYRYTFDGEILYIDHGTLIIFDLLKEYPDPSQAIGKNIADLIEYVGPHGLIRDELRKHGRVQNYEYPFKTLNGKPRWVLHDSYVVYDPAIDTQIIQAIIRDITPLKLTEEALRKSEARLTAAIDIMPIPFAIISNNKSLLDVSQANRAIAEFFRSDDPNIWWNSQLLDPETHTPVPRDRWPVYRSLCGEECISVEYIILTEDGREIPVLQHSGPIFVGNDVVGAVLVFQDISALKAADRAKNQFLAILSHELKTPLSSILGWAQLAINSDDREATDRALIVIERNALRQRGILDDLLDVSRIIYGKLILQCEHTDLWQLAAQCAEDMEQALQERRQKLTMEPPDTPLHVFADPARIRQVITNLLANAMKFTPKGGEITVRGIRRDCTAVITVRDNGIGIAPEMLSVLFKPFQQAQRSETTGGLGLGLALAYGIINLHQGSIIAESPGLGQGSLFTIELPIINPE